MVPEHARARAGASENKEWASAMLETCILAIESYEMYESLDKKCFHMYFALDYNVELLFSFLFLVSCLLIIYNQIIDLTRRLPFHTAATFFPASNSRFGSLSSYSGKIKERNFGYFFRFSFYECTRHVRVLSHVPTV